MSVSCVCLYCHWATNTFISYIVRCTCMFNSTHAHKICAFHQFVTQKFHPFFASTVLSMIYPKWCCTIPQLLLRLIIVIIHIVRNDTHICTKQMMNKVPRTYVRVCVCNLNLYFYALNAKLQTTKNLKFYVINNMSNTTK